ncbi:MAG: hypothetical protein R3288_07395 [Woeseiaceae bacterium]|nr:hypothetical protein [Woeseiaceae bacterium]
MVLADVTRAVKRVLVVLAAAAAALALILSLLWRDRPALADITIADVPAFDGDEDAVTATWFGVTTLLIDDGETQILIDGFISRPTLLDVLMRRDVTSDAATINFFLNEYRVRRLAAVIPIHSHFDHAMDIGAIANRSSASILGSATSANIARGVGVPEDQIVVVQDGAEYTFGAFTVRFIESVHAPVGWGGSVPLPGTIDEPLPMPAPITAFREGGSYAVLVKHDQGTALIQGSAGISANALDGVTANTVLLGVGLLEGLGRDYMENYWRTTVTSTGADMVIPVHFDDYTQRFGDVVLLPRFLDNFADTASALLEFRGRWDGDARLFLPRFGVAFALYPEEDPEV